MADGLIEIQRVRLGGELRRLRERAGLSQEDAARHLMAHRAQVNRVEGGSATIKPGEVMTLLTYYGVDLDSEDAVRIVDIAAEAMKRTTTRGPDWARGLLGFEYQAVEIKTFEGVLVPGLLQTEAYSRAVTEAYARAMAEADPTRNPEEEAERLVAVRRERQARLTGDDPPQLRAVIGEEVIRRPVGGQSVMREQLERLREMGNLPTVSLRVLPSKVGAHAALGTSFSIFQLPGPGGAEVAYVEHLLGAEYLKRAAPVKAYTKVFEKVCQVALNTTGSTALIKEAIGDLR